MFERFLLPQQLKNFLEFCGYRNKSEQTHTLDLTNCTWLYPSTLLPLAAFLKQNPELKYLPPKNGNVARYFSVIIDSQKPKDNCTYLPIVNLPKSQDKANSAIERIYGLHNNGKEYGGEQAFKYLISELSDNIYQHSKFCKAFIMAQRYERHGFAEICFFDDGITIKGAFEKKGMSFEDYEAIAEALNGTSTKGDERGFGLSSNMDIFTEGIHGELLVVSGSGAIYVNKRKRNAYKFQTPHKLSGTLVSVKIPYPAPQVNIYDYI